MKNLNSSLVIYRCLPFKEWHQPFETTGGKWYPGGEKYECDCPYGSHTDVRFLDYKDPLHLNEILSLKEGMKLLTFYSWKGTEHVAFHTFEKFEFLSDFIRLMFVERVSVYENTEEQFTPIRLIAVIDNANNAAAFGIKGGVDVFIGELSKLTGVSIYDIEQQIDELNKTPISSKEKLSTEEITENAKIAGICVW